MTIFTDGLRRAPERVITDFDTTLGDTLAASASLAVDDYPSVSLHRIAELEAARGRDDLAGTDLARSAGVGDMGDGGLRDVPIAQARQRVKDAGLDQTLTLPDSETIRAPVLDIMIERARSRREREATISRGPQGIVADALQFGTSFLTSVADPLNVAAGFIPVVGEARYAKMLANAGEQLAARSAVRAQLGAVEGAVGTAALEPLVAIARLDEGQDYTFTEALRSVLFGAGMGAGFHSLFGGVRDIYRRRKGLALNPRADDAAIDDIERPTAPVDRIDPDTGEVLSDVPPPSPIAVAMTDLPPRAQEDLMRGALADLADGRPVRSGEMLEVAAGIDPRIAERFDSAPARAIEIDVQQQLRAAGLSPEEADANAAIVAARYMARADRLEGRAGDALDLYRGEGLQVRRGDNAAADDADRVFHQAARTVDATTNPDRAPVTKDFPVNTTGDVVAGDTIRFSEAVYAGSHRNPVYRGERIVEAEVMRDSYGADKQQHTFSLRVLRSEGVEPLVAGTETRRKGRNVYRNGVRRQRWTNEDARAEAADEKHMRGGAARSDRAMRREAEGRTFFQSDRVLSDTREFKAWFGESKVVDSEGKPTVVFHGTARGGFDTFDTYGGEYGLMGQGSYFTENPSIASEYTAKGRKRLERDGQVASMSVYPVHLAIKRPLDMDAPADIAAWQRAFPDWIDADTAPKNATNEQMLRELEDVLSQESIPSYEGAEIVQSGFREMGFDGVTHMGGGRVDADGPRHRVWIAFEPEQIKSAIGNRGTFDVADPNILHQADKAGGPRGRISLSENRAIIELFEKANASTFMHESGHLWLDELVRDAARADAPPSLKQDFDTVLFWLGAEKPEDVGTAQHEKFARGFELYLAEGRAPTTALAAAFEQFKRWLTRIYRSLTELDVRINDDIRGVFDRMLATEADLGRLRNLPELPKGVREAGFGPLGPELDGFQNRWQDAVDWLSRAETGDARGVLSHPDVGGPIDVIWGNHNYGLAHIIYEHPEVVPNLPERLTRMRLDHVVQAGKAGERIVLRSPDGQDTAIVRSTWDGKKKAWLLTAYTPDSERGGGGSGRPGGGTTESPPGVDPTRSSGQPTDSNVGPVADPGKMDPDAYARLADRAEDPGSLAASREADQVAEPDSLLAEPGARRAAIERLAHDAEDLWTAHEAYIPDDLKKKVANELETLAIAEKDRADVIRRGAACLAAAVG